MFQHSQIPFLSFHVGQSNDSIIYPSENTFMGMLQSPLLFHSLPSDYKYPNARNTWSPQQPFLVQSGQNHMLPFLPHLNIPCLTFPTLPGNSLICQNHMVSHAHGQKYDLKNESLKAENKISSDTQTVSRLKREFSYINTDGFRPDDVECLSFSSLLDPNITFGNYPHWKVEKLDNGSKKFCYENLVVQNNKTANFQSSQLMNMSSSDLLSTSIAHKSNSTKESKKKRSEKRLHNSSHNQIQNISASSSKMIFTNIETQKESCLVEKETTEKPSSQLNNCAQGNTMEKKLYYENKEFYRYNQYLHKVTTLVSDVKFHDRLSQLFYNQLSRPVEDVVLQSVKSHETGKKTPKIHVVSEELLLAYTGCTHSLHHLDFVQPIRPNKNSKGLLMKLLSSPAE